MLRYVALEALAGCQLVFSPADKDAPAFCPVAPRECSGNDPDEDGDGERDDCDECPQLGRENDTVVDTDSDGIGDACDPDAGVEQACRQRWFFGFEPSSADRLETNGVSWVFDGDAAPEDPDFATNRLRVLSREDHGTGRVEAFVDDGNPVPGSPDQLAGVTVLADDTRGFACGIRQDPDGAVGTLAIVNLGEDRVLAESPEFSVTPGVGHRIRLVVSPGGFVACASFGDGGLEAGPLTRQETLPEAASGRVGIVLVGTTATFRYLDFIPD